MWLGGTQRRYRHVRRGSSPTGFDTQTVRFVTTCHWYHHHHPAVCLTTGSKPLPKRFLHTVRSKASSFKWEYPLLSLRISSSFLRLLPCLLVTYISPFIFPSITCFRRQFLRKMWPVHWYIMLKYAFRLRFTLVILSLVTAGYRSFENRSFLVFHGIFLIWGKFLWAYGNTLPSWKLYQQVIHHITDFYTD